MSPAGDCFYLLLLTGSTSELSRVKNEEPADPDAESEP
jgi:hypothetical protein